MTYDSRQSSLLTNFCCGTTTFCLLRERRRDATRSRQTKVDILTIIYDHFVHRQPAFGSSDDNDTSVDEYSGT